MTLIELYQHASEHEYVTLVVTDADSIPYDFPDGVFVAEVERGNVYQYKSSEIIEFIENHSVLITNGPH